jgi:catechol 2,3-dioxygenase-like lactoylglutathione lyase family enzyme
MERIVSKLLQDFERGKMTRRQLIQSLTVAATAASAMGAVSAGGDNVSKAVNINHVSYQVVDYAKTRDFYAGLFGMEVSEDNGRSCRLTFGNDILIARNLGSRGPGSGSSMPGVDHIAYTIANWDTDRNVRGAVGTELKRRGLKVREEKSGFHIKDPDGFDVQIGGKEQ